MELNTRDIKLSAKQKAKALISLRGSAVNKCFVVFSFYIFSIFYAQSDSNWSKEVYIA